MRSNKDKLQDMTQDTYHNIIRQRGTAPRLLRYTLIILMMIGGSWVNEVWGQTDYTGIYYIANSNNNTGNGYIGTAYNVNTPATNFYLVPAGDPQQNNAIDAYYSPNHNTQNGDPEKPFLTTHYITKPELNAIWIIVKSSTNGYYNIIHAKTGKYVIHEIPLPNQENRRKAVHLQTPDNESYSISTNDYYNYGISNPTIGQYLIEVKNPPSNHKYWNPAGQNNNNYYGNGNTFYHNGLVGLYNGTTNNSIWYFESGLLSAPSISAVDATTSKVTVTDNNSLPEGYNIRYTVSTSGSAPADPTATSEIMTNNEYQVSQTCIIKAVVERYGVVLTEVATSGSLVSSTPNAPTFTENCDNTFELSCSNNPTAAIYYTLTTNGDNPQDPTTNSTPYDDTTPIPFQATTKVKAIAVSNNRTSSIASKEYTSADLYPEKPVITLEATSVTISGPSGATIHYTTDGNDPTTSSASYSSAIQISESADIDIRAIAVKDGKESCVERLVTLGAPEVTFTSDDCSETSPRGNVMTITGLDDGRTFWYAVTPGNSSTAPDPTANPNPYTQYNSGTPVSIDDLADSNNAYCRVHAYAMSALGDRSAITSVTYMLKTSGKPILTPPTGSSNALDISNGTAGDKVICSYTDNNGTPNDNTDDYNVTDNSTIVGSDRSAIFYIPNTATGTITVSFKRGEWQTSCEATYLIPGIPPTPTWSQDSDNRLSLSCSDGMAVIHYTTDGTEPTMSSPTYSVGCLYNIEVETTIKAIAVKGFRISSVMTYTYRHTHVAAPEFFVEGNQVTITAPDGATIYYTVSTNGNNNESETIAEPVDPTAIPANLYNEAYTLTGITKIKAIAVKDGLQNSNIASITTREGYTIDGTDEYPLSLLNDPNLQGKYFFLSADFTAPANYTSVTNFTGVLVGNNHTISGLTKPLFATATGAVIHDLNLKDVTINEATGNAGAIAKTAAGDTRIYNCGILPTTADGATNSTISGAAYVGGLVGELTDEARVINCFSYANITGGTHRAGIVGYNGYASTTKSNDLKTMIMNCMYYGNISTQGSTAISPIYGGKKISNAYKKNVTDGLDNFNYFYFNRDYVSSITDYNCALGAEERFLNRFEFFRQTLNSTRDLAAWYVSGTVDDKELMGKWVLDKKIAPYPILKAPGVYPSVTNPDAKNAQPIDANNEYYNKGRKLGTITVTLSGTGITTASLTLNITDKDPDNFNFNYKKIQLPYFNEVGTGNYTNNMVVTGWKITNITPVDNDPYSPQHYTAANYDAPYYNFVDRKSSNKDLYSVSGRIFNQGAYWEVPDNVSSITIEPVWAECVYLADLNYDVTYEGKSINLMGDRDLTSQLGNQTVYNDINTALSNLGTSATSVYDYAIVLVGNYHKAFDTKSPTDGRTAPLTIMSADFDNDNEPDYTFFYQHTERLKVAPIRFDFINIPGMGMVQKADGVQSNYQVGIFRPSGWFEITNTVNIYFGQFEYADPKDNGAKVIAPVILQGGVYEQFVSARHGNATKTQYLLVGGNAWFKTFANGCHTNTFYQTPKIPINVAGGEFEKFYLSGIYQPYGVPTAENAECYIDGGKFGEVAGAGMQRINGNVTWLINGADINSFYGGGINASSPISGNISTTISNSRIGEFCGGPKFGNMAGYNTAATDDDKTIATTATNCDFTTFFGAGHGGTSINRIGVEDLTYNKDVDYTGWDSWVSTYYQRSYQTDQTTNIPTGTSRSQEVNAISTGYEYDYIFYSGGASKNKVARFYVNFASMDLANTNSVSSTLSKCKVGTFYGGGKLGAVNGNATSILTDCSVTGNAYGAGYSAAAPTVDVTPRENSDGIGFEIAPKYDNAAGVFNSELAKAPDAVTYTWDDDPDNFTNLETSYFNDTDHLLFTGWTKDENNQDIPISLEGLGKVNGTASITINGKSTIGTQNDATTGNVYGGGELSNVDNTVINIDGRTVILGNVFGGGKGEADNFTCDKAMVGIDGAGADEVNYPSGYPDGNTSVNIKNGTIEGNVYGGGEVGRVEMNTTITIGLESGTSTPVVKGCVFGGGKGVETHGYSALVRGNPTVIIQGDAKVRGSVYGGGEIGSVARYKVKTAANDPDAPKGWPMGMPYALKDVNSGFCTVTIQGNAEIGPEGSMSMITSSGKPDDTGHVFGAGRGILPREYDYVDETHYSGGGSYIIDDHMPSRMDNNGVWEHFTTEPAYIGFIQTLALASETNVTIGGNAFVKGSVYGGSENGIVQYNTHVTIQDDCQIGCGKNTTERYSDAVWADGYTPTTDLECASWAYGKTTGNTTVYLPYDMFDLDANNKPKPASDGHSFYGNVFGGGSGYYPYRRKSAALDGAAWTIDNAKTAEVGQPVDANGYSDGVWLRSAGVVRGNTTVTITGGHILTSVYGGNEQTDVEGSCTVNMSGGTLGVPRTVAQILDHPVTCYLFGAGRGDQRINFNTWNNVASVNVNITGGRIYGSVFGGGEDGHVIGDVALSISGNSTKIGTTGTSYVDGNVFGGGRGFSGEAQTAGTVSGNVTMNISGGEMLGSIYGGGRLASVGTQFTSPEDYNYGNFLEDNKAILYTQAECDEHNEALNGYIPSGTPLTAAQAEAYNAAMSASKAEGSTLDDQEAASYNATLPEFKTTTDIRIPAGSHGHVTIYISGGTIGNDRENKVYTSAINTSGKTDEQIKTERDAEIAGFKATDGIPNTTFEYDAESNKYIVAHTVGGNVFGGSMGRLTLLNGSINPIWPKMAQVKTTEVNIYGNATIKRNVYGGGELGTVREDAYVTIGGQKTADADEYGNVTVNPSGSPTINRNVFGGGLGSEDDDTHTIINVYELKENATFPYVPTDYEQHQYAFTPMQFAGCVGQNTYVNVVGGQIKKNVYGGGEIASVGVIDCLVESKSTGSITNSDVVVSQDNSESIIYSHMTDHSRSTDNDGRFFDFGISWPFEFNYVDGFEGATHVKISGGRLGITGKDIMFEGGIKEDNGDVFGAGKGIAGDYHQYVFCANVGSSDVKIAYNNTSDPSTYKTDNSNCITGSVYAGSENGHVIGDTHLTLSGGLIGHAIYGGGKGKGTYDVWLNKITQGVNGVSNITDNTPDDPSSVSAPATRNDNTEYKATIYSITAGKVFGNTNITMSGGYVMRNVYGGGNMGSVGKGNYSGGPDDYSKTGYGELPPSGKNLWATDTYGENEVNYAQHFRNSGKSTVTITSGTIGYIDSNDPSKSVKEGLPYGNVFGGCRGESAPNIGESPRYKYSPSSYSGYVNETVVTIGDNNGGPTILGSVYGGGQDGHVRRDTKVTINNGEIGIAYNPDNKTLLNTSDTEDTQWLHRGNVYGAGSGIGQYTYDFNYDGDYLDEVDYYNPQTKKTTRLKETDYSTSAGSVTRFTYVEIKGGTIHRNVYGGGSVASVGAPKIPYTVNNELVIPSDPYHKGDTETGHGEGLQSYNEVIISGGQIGDSYSYDNTGNHLYGGNVLAASRGQNDLGPSFSTSVWTDLSISGGNIKGDVYGGGEIGAVICGVDVNMLGGTIEHSIYGGGALANTNTSNWGTNDFATGKITTSGKRTTTFNTKLNLLGGTIGGEAYGGGLGRLASGTEGQSGYIAPVEAMVYGDVFVNLNGLDRNDFDNNTVPSNLSSKVSSIPGSNHEFRINTSGVKGAQVNKIFGGNNLNGTPKGHIKVHVYATQNKDVTKTDIGAKFVKQNLDLTKLTLAEDATQEKVTAFISKLKGILLDNIKFATALGIESIVVSDYQAIYDNNDASADVIKDAITDLMEAMDSKIENAADPDAEKAKISAMRFDMQAVYGGGNLSEYVYGNGNKITEDEDGTDVIEAARTEVIIDGCDYTSIKQVYGGGNAAATSGSYVRVNETYEIDEVFGGGNGADNYYLLENNPPVWYENPGANVGYHDFTQVDKNQGNGAKLSPYKTVDQATTPEARTSYAFGSGIATTEIRGGTIHNLYGGSNKRGNIRTAARTSIEDSNDDCPIIISETYGGGKDAPMDAEIDMALDCVKEKVDIIYGGAKNADLYSDVTLNITNGSYGRVFGANNEGGALYGSITVNIEEKGCVPIEIDELYGGGYLAPYSIYGYQKDNNGDYVLDSDGKLIPLASGNNPYHNPRINIISATRIGTIYGGGYQAKMVGDPYINVNMQAGKMDVVKVEKKETDNVEIDYITHDDESGKDYVYKDAYGHYYTSSSIEPDPNDQTGTKFTTSLTLGHIGTIYGGGNEAEVVGDTHVEIGTGLWITSFNENNGVPIYSSTGGRNSAQITGDVFGGGDNAAVLHNTNVTIANGSIGNNVYGGGNLGNVGTITTEQNSGGGTDYIWDQNTGVASVIITGGTVGPDNLNPSTNKESGNVFGAGKGSAISFECENAMVDYANVNITNGTVRGSVYGGGEIGRVENNTIVTIGVNDNSSTPEIKGNVFGGGAGVKTHGYSALVRGNSTVTIQGGSTIGLNVYGGGEIASVGKYKIKKSNNPITPSDAPANLPIGMPYALFSDNLGICTVNIQDAAEIAGNVFGAGQGIIPQEYDYASDQDDHKPKRMGMTDWEYLNSTSEYLTFVRTLALTTKTYVTIGGNTATNVKVKGSVYGGSENGFVQFDTDVKIQANCNIYGNVYGGGLGLLSYSDAGIVNGNTNVAISGGFIRHNVYGGGELGSVGTIENLTDIETSLYKHSEPTTGFALSWPYEFIYKTGTGKATVTITGGRLGRSGKDTFDGRTQEINAVLILRDENGKPILNNGKVQYIDANGNPLSENDDLVFGPQTIDLREDNGDVYGGSKGLIVKGAAEAINDYRYKEAFIANVRETDVKIQYPSTPSDNDIQITLIKNAWDEEDLDYKDKYALMLNESLGGIAGSVYGGGEDGHVYENTKVTISNGYIGHSVYGGGKGKGAFLGNLKTIENNHNTYSDDVTSWTAGKVYGNTTIEMTGGHVMRNIYGGGNMGSVGKGNYASGTDDYYPAGYGEKLSGRLWTTSATESAPDNAWHFLNSGKTTVTIKGGTIGFLLQKNGSNVVWIDGVNSGSISGIDASSYTKYAEKVCFKDDLPTGNVFGGSRGQSAPNVGALSPRYEYAPDFYLGYVNETAVTIGDNTAGPAILGSVYGGGQDGHVRRDTKVTINKGVIGLAYSQANIDNLGGSDSKHNKDSKYWMHRGNVYGAGSGIGKYTFNFYHDGGVHGDVTENSSSSGSVTRSTEVTIGSTMDGTDNIIYRNVYGGGSLASIGPPKIPASRTDEPFLPDDTNSDNNSRGKQTICKVIIEGTVGHTVNTTQGIGGNVFGSSRGEGNLMNEGYGTSFYTDVLLKGDAHVLSNVYGGGESSNVSVSTKVMIGDVIVNPAPLRTEPAGTVDAGTNAATQSEQQRTVSPAPASNAATESTGARTISTNRANQ